jgi:5-methylcytosine-specific restriction endonuclease McrA
MPLVKSPWLYDRRWRKRRAAQLKAEPFCSMCLAEGVYTLADVADHIEPHRQDPVKFAGPLQSLCKSHHDRDKQLIELGRPLLGVDADGWPIAGPSVAEGGR